MSFLDIFLLDFIEIKSGLDSRLYFDTMNFRRNLSRRVEISLFLEPLKLLNFLRLFILIWKLPISEPLPSRKKETRKTNHTYIQSLHYRLPSGQSDITRTHDDYTSFFRFFSGHSSFVRIISRKPRKESSFRTMQ